MKETDFINIDISHGTRPISSVQIPIPTVMQIRERKCSKGIKTYTERLVGKPLSEWTKAAILSTLYQTCGNCKKASETLEMPTEVFYQKCKELAIDIDNIKNEIRILDKLNKRKYRRKAPAANERD